MNIRNFEGNKLEGIKGKKVKYILDDNFHFVEEYVAKLYAADGKKTIFSENEYWWNLFAVIYWNIIFARVDGAVNGAKLGTEAYNQQFEFNLKVNGMPNDFFREEFYQNRLELFNDLDKKITNNEITFKEILLKNHKENYGKLCRPIENWNKYSLEELTIIFDLIDDNIILKIFNRFATDFNNNRSGLPDLLIYDDKEILFVEVKSESDSISENQIQWIKYLDGIGLKTVIATINHTDRKIKNLEKKLGIENNEVEDSKKLKKVKTASKPTKKKEEATPLEILFLSNNDRVNLKEDSYYPGYWEYNYDINPNDLAESLVEKGFYQPISLKNSLSWMGVIELKDILRENKLKVSGRKAELVERIVEGCDHEEITKKYVPSTSYELSTSAEEIIKLNPHLEYYHKNSNISYELQLTLKQFHRLVLKNNGDYHNAILHKTVELFNKNLKRKDYGLARNASGSLCAIYKEVNSLEGQLDSIFKVLYFDLCGMSNDNSYNEAMVDINNHQLSILENLIYNNDIPSDKLKEYYLNSISNISLRRQRFTNTEIFDLITRALEEGVVKVNDEIYINFEACEPEENGRYFDYIYKGLCEDTNENSTIKVTYKDTVASQKSVDDKSLYIRQYKEKGFFTKILDWICRK